jgi:uncharacterized RDD family membrane protein YckC
MSDNLQDELIDYDAPKNFGGNVVYGSFLNRFAAAFIDGLIVQIPLYIIQFALPDAAVAISGLGILAQWLYFAVQESGADQATIGKKLLGLKVTDIYGDRISFGKATGRYFSKIISALILLIGYIMAAFTDKKQALHDMIAGTLVVSTK